MLKAEEFEYKLAVMTIGKAYVGKSMLIKRFCSGKFQEEPKTTLGMSLATKKIKLKDKLVTLELWDTYGNERYYYHQKRL